MKKAKKLLRTAALISKASQSNLTDVIVTVFTNIVWFFEIYNKTSAERFRAISF